MRTTRGVNKEGGRLNSQAALLNGALRVANESSSSGALYSRARALYSRALYSRALYSRAL